jgi:hypothetical protein
MKPKIKKLGTVDCDLVETNPFVFQGRLFRLESILAGNREDRGQPPYLRIVEPASGWRSEPFGQGHCFGTAFVDDDMVHVTAAAGSEAERINIFASRDLRRWETREALHLPGWGIFNTSVCRAEGRYVMMFEINKPPEEAGVWFTARFATSPDLRRWELTPSKCAYARTRYAAPHCLRYDNGYYYNFFLECFSSPCGGQYPYRYEQHVVRSKDLVTWESSPLNPVLAASEADRLIANPALGQDLLRRIEETVDVNNSDIDFCEYQGRLIINYSWGDQQVNMHVAEAVYEGTLSDFLRGWFPEKEA